MFRSQKIRRRPGSNSTRSRRLGVELMEGRMMLSATGFDVPQPVLDVAQFTFSPARISLLGAHIKLATPPTDGGYVNSDSLSVAASGNGGLAVANDVTALLSGIGVRNQAFTEGTTSTWQDHLSLFNGGGPQPAVIMPWSDGGTLESTISPVVVGPSPSMPGTSEGGSILIHAIFADFRKDSHLASGVKAGSSPTGETSINSLASARRVSATDNAIAGEWARAMVFEIAGGEPDPSDSQSLDGERATTADSVETLQHGEPLSSVEALRQNERQASQHAAGPTKEGGVPGQPQAAQSTAQIAAVVAALNPFHATKFVPNDTLAADNATGTKTPEITAAAAAIFDQLGDANAAVIESSTSGKSWLHSIGTSPLLMILALERIAALNSRRATREPRVAAARKPLRSL